MKNKIVSQELLIREMGAGELIDYVSKLENNENNQPLIKKCFECYKQLTGKNIFDELS